MWPLLIAAVLVRVCLSVTQVCRSRCKYATCRSPTSIRRDSTWSGRHHTSLVMLRIPEFSDTQSTAERAAITPLLSQLALNSLIPGWSNNNIEKFSICDRFFLLLRCNCQHFCHLVGSNRFIRCLMKEWRLSPITCYKQLVAQSITHM